MKLKEIEKFVTLCFENDVTIPSDLIIICSDWNEKVPEEYKEFSNIEYNVIMNEEYGVKINIAPITN
jgi:hypothetical protein